MLFVSYCDEVRTAPAFGLYLATCESKSSTEQGLGSPPYTRLPGGHCQCPAATTRPWPSDCVFPKKDSPHAEQLFGLENAQRLELILNFQPNLIWQERYIWRHPFETLSFFGVKPGMVVVEADPGSLWYTRILKDYLGDGGELIGMDYPPPFNVAGAWGYTNFTSGFPSRVHHHFGHVGAKISAFESGSLPHAMHGTADVVLLIRILHDFTYFSHLFGLPWKPVMQMFLRDCYTVLKPTGRVGVIDHDAGPHMPETWINNGYLTRLFVTEQMHDGGFRLVSSSTINENPSDMPRPNDTVWRLAPTFNRGKTRDVISIGESNRMTLLFRRVTK